MVGVGRRRLPNSPVGWVGFALPDRKTRKRRSEEKGMDFSSASLFPTRKRKAINQGGTTGIDHPMRRRTQGAGIFKAWEDKRDRMRILDTFM